MADTPETIALRGLFKKLAEEETPETPEQAAERDAAHAKRQAEQAARLAKYEEDQRLAVPRDIERLRKEAADKLSEAAKLESLLTAYPNVRKRVGRWQKVAYYSKDVNEKVTRFDIRHNCGCCSDSPLEIWPYLETPHGNIYSDPPMFRVGEKNWMGGDSPSKGWKGELQRARLPKDIIGAVEMHFKRSREERMELAAAENEVDPEESESE